MWSKKGYRVLSRTSTTAQLCKPHQSPLLVGPIALMVLLGAWTLIVLPFNWAVGLFVAGMVLLSGWHAVRGEHLVYLVVAEDGSIIED